MSTISIYRLHPISSERETLGTISEQDLDFLAENLQEEFEEDEDYFIDHDALEYMRDQGGSMELLALLEKALEGEDEGIEIGYQIA